jgi:DNA-binding NarL/FixJ family response regulator
MNTEARRSGVAACLLEGMSNAAIAAALGVHRHTVEHDVRTLQQRYQAGSRVALALALERLLMAEAV